ncbi:MAG: hypothetical protein RTU92_02625 [Candidatus Thorarchaeota archaeon]
MKAIKINDDLVGRLDEVRERLSLGTRQNAANTLLRKSLDYEKWRGYEELLKIPAKGKNEMVQASE